MPDDPRQDSTDAAPPGDDQRSPAWARFYSCRWHHPADEGVHPHCSHRDVLPMTGQHGFDAESWCADCSFFKLRRTPRKPTFR
jgi:hypothetical protein